MNSHFKRYGAADIWRKTHFYLSHLTFSDFNCGGVSARPLPATYSSPLLYIHQESNKI